MVGEPKDILNIKTPDETTAIHEEAAANRIVQLHPEQEPELDALAAHIRVQWEIMRNHRTSTGVARRGSINLRLINALRTFHGQYPPDKLQEIKTFGGSEVYARVTAVKCRGATSLLRDVYLGPDRPWDVEPTPEPTLPENLVGTIVELVTAEADKVAAAGQPVSPDQLKQRMDQMMDAARLAAVKKARQESKEAATRIEDILVEGNFYRAFAEFLVDLPLFLYACLKGPVVRVTPGIEWVDGQAVPKDTPKLYWERVSPFDVYWSPGASDIEDADVIEKVRFTRADLNAVLGVAGYDEVAVRKVLQEYGDGLVDYYDDNDSERADYEDRENPNTNRTGLIHGLEYHGRVQGKTLLEYGFKEDEVPDEDRDYAVQAWLIGQYIIKAQLAPSPKKRHPYYTTSFEKVPGTPIGNGLPDILEDIQDIVNASARALVNNLSISSGPQVVVMADLAMPGQDIDSLYPWKRWHMQSDPSGGNKSRPPVDFFQPDSNAAELMSVFEKFSGIADEISAIPRYVTGSNNMGGAGRTASGLAMLMGNASKVLQTVAANIDNDVMNPLLSGLYDMLMLTDTTGVLRGDEQIRVRGVNVAVQRETERMRQLEFIQATANPMDAEILGAEGRASILRQLANNLGLGGDEIVPSEEEIRGRQKQRAMAEAAAAGTEGAPAQIGSDPAAVDNMVPTGPG